MDEKLDHALDYHVAVALKKHTAIQFEVSHAKPFRDSKVLTALIHNNVKKVLYPFIGVHSTLRLEVALLSIT